MELTRCPHCGKTLRYVSIAEAAERLGIDRTTVFRWVQAGRFKDAVEETAPGGTRWLIPTREVDRLVRQREKG